uniref:Nucleocapsid protein n=1 Tax=Coleopteran rhabdo-related virus OKIAV20 TaxID=2746287 RepID=A0A7D7EY09_9RHAB|nr:nucleocapsid protein [Coleopteran rhabdo-related virus OKIAV20]
MSCDFQFATVVKTINKGTLSSIDWDDKAAIVSGGKAYPGDSLANAVTNGKFLLNSYVNGQIGKADLKDMLLTSIGSMQLEGAESSLFKKAMPDGSYVIDIHNLGTWIEWGKDMSGYFPEADHDTQNVVTDDKTPDDNQATKEDTEESTTAQDVTNFYTEMVKLADSKDPIDQKNFINIVGWMSLVIMRLTTRTITSVSGFLAKRGVKTYNNLFGGEFTFMIPPPHFKFMIAFNNACSKGSDGNILILKHLLTTYKAPGGEEGYNNSVRSVLKAGCLLHLEYNGMVPVKSLIHISRISGKFINDILIRFSITAFKETLIRLDHVLSTYYNEEITLFPWARLIKDNYHSDLASSMNKNWLMLMFYIISRLDKDQAEGIWEQKPFNGMPELPAAIKGIGGKFIDECTRLDVTVLNDHAYKIDQGSTDDDILD